MKFYRYKISNIPHTPNVILEEYSLKRETPMGYWIGYSWTEWGQRWIPKKSKKRFAYPTKEEAMVNFVKRTEMRVQYLKRDIAACERALISLGESIYACDSCKYYPCPSKVKLKKGECGDYDFKQIAKKHNLKNR